MTAIGIFAGSAASAGASSLAPLEPAAMARLGTIDEGFQSFNIEMVEVTGGKFWKPYHDVGTKPPVPTIANPAGVVPAGMDPSLYQYRPPIDLANPRLRALAGALAPAYMRVSGTWANSTYFHDADTPAPATPPSGFGAVLTIDAPDRSADHDAWRRQRRACAANGRPAPICNRAYHPEAGSASSCVEGGPRPRRSHPRPELGWSNNAMPRRRA
jgi:hypothetical protein